MRPSLPWIVLVAASSLIGVAAPVIYHHEPPTLGAVVRQAAADNEGAAFEHVYEHEVGDHELTWFYAVRHLECLK